MVKEFNSFFSKNRDEALKEIAEILYERYNDLDSLHKVSSDGFEKLVYAGELDFLTTLLNELEKS